MSRRDAQFKYLEKSAITTLVSQNNPLMTSQGQSFLRIDLNLGI